jgi:hypothetical protein
MQRVLIVTGVLGLGTAIVFGLAALTATLFPNGTLVAGGWNGMVVDQGWAVGKGGAVAVPLPPVTVNGGSTIELPASTPEPGPS